MLALKVLSKSTKTSTVDRRNNGKIKNMPRITHLIEVHPRGAFHIHPVEANFSFFSQRLSPELTLLLMILIKRRWSLCSCDGKWAPNEGRIPQGSASHGRGNEDGPGAVWERAIVFTEAFTLPQRLREQQPSLQYDICSVRLIIGTIKREAW